LCVCVGKQRLRRSVRRGDSKKGGGGALKRNGERESGLRFSARRLHFRFLVSSHRAETPPRFTTMTADAPTPPPSLPDEILRRHAGKPGAESRALVGVLGAVLDAVRSRGLDPSPAALFAALMAALDGPRALEDPQVRRGEMEGTQAPDAETHAPAAPS